MPQVAFRVRWFALLSFLMWGCNGPQEEPNEAPAAEQARPGSELATAAQALSTEPQDATGEPGTLDHPEENPYLRFAHVTWRPVGPHTAEFSVLSAFSREAHPGSGPDGRVVTGDLFTSHSSNLWFGEDPYGEPERLTFEAIGHDVEQGWVLARAVTAPGIRPMPGTGVTVTATEPNGSFETANSMNLGDDYVSELTSWDDYDFVRFTLPRQTRIFARTAPGAVPNSHLQLYSSSGETLASIIADWQYIDLTLQAGTYYLETTGSLYLSGGQTVQLREVGPMPAGPITHTYGGYGPYTAFLEGCCRNNSSVIVGTQVRFDLPNRSPVSTLQAESPITVPANTLDFSLQIPATDADGDELTFRLASHAESGIDELPPGLSVSPSGLVSWNTTGLHPGMVWPVQVVIEEHREGQRIGSSAVEFVLRTGPRLNQPPVCLVAQTEYNVSPSETLAFGITASDPDEGDLVALFLYGEPSGASYETQDWPWTSHSVAGTFSWRPSASLVGSTVTLTFMAEDMMGATALCPVTIHVVAAPTSQPPVANAGPDQFVSEGAQVLLDGRGSSDPEGERLSYEWIPSSPNAHGVLLSSSTSPTATFTPPDNGTYSFVLSVTDARGLVSYDSVDVIVSNVAPGVHVEGGGVAPGTAFTSPGTLIDPGADSFGVTVDYGDGSGPQPLDVQGRVFILDHFYADGGTYPVTISVQDDDGGEATATVQVVVTEAVPVVSASGGSVDEGSPFTAPGSFTATSGTSWTATVNYGDGTGWQPLALDGQSFTLGHTYADNGFYYVSIRVTDNLGITGMAMVAVQVSNVAPQLSAPSVTVNEGETFTTTVTLTDPGADHWIAWVDYGYGQGGWVNVNSDGTLTLSHRYDYPGEQLIFIAVFDDDEGLGELAVPVVVTNIPPVVKISTVGTAHEGDWWNGSGIVGSLPQYPSVYAYVDYGDGSGPEPLNFYYNEFWLSHRYENDGVYTVTVTVVEDDGTTATDSAQVVVQNVAPQVVLYAPWLPYGDEGSEIGMGFRILDADYDQFTATVDFGDGSGEQSVPVGRDFGWSHTYARSGIYTVTVTVMDDDGATGTFTLPVTVWNVVPYVGTWDGGGSEGSAYTSSGYFGDPGEETGWTAMVDYGDGTGLQPATFTSDPYGTRWLELTHVYANDGYYMVTTYVTDADGGVGMNISSAWIDNVDPQVTMPEWVSVDEGSTFTASGSFVDPGADTWTATVDYGDGSYPETLELVGNTFQLNHVYTRPGVYGVSVTVWDGTEDWGGYGFGGTYAEVLNVVPVVTVEGGTIARGSVFTSSGSFTDPGEGEWYVSVDYGDGTDSEWMVPNGKTFELSHLYEQPGTYTVTVSVYDWYDVVTTTVQVVVLSPPPVVSLQGASLSEGEWLTLQGSFSTSANQVTATVDYGDGLGEQPLSLQGTTFTLGHVYMDNGTYSVTVRILDEHGGLGTATAQVVVHNVAPTVTVSADAPQYWGLPVHFSGTVMDAGGADTAAGFATGWTFGDGIAASDLSAAHAYANPGSYVAVLTAEDKDGASSSASTPVEIRQRPSSLTCDDAFAVFGFPVSLSAQLADALPGAQLGGKWLTFRVGTSPLNISRITDNDGVGSMPSSEILIPGRYTVTVSFEGDSHYTGAQAECSLTVTGSDGRISGSGLKLGAKTRAGFNVKVDENGQLGGELQFKNESFSFRSSTMWALGIAPDRLSGWFSGIGEDGQHFQAYVEDHGDHGTGDVFQLWIDGDLVTGSGQLTGGNIRIQEEPIALAP